MLHHRNRLDAFFYRGVRSLLNLPSTYAQTLEGVERTASNAFLLEELKARLALEVPSRRPPNIQIPSQIILGSQTAFMGHLMRAHSNPGPQSRVLFTVSRPIALKFHHIRRVGRPRISWSKSVLAHIYDTYFPLLAPHFVHDMDLFEHICFNSNDPRHLLLLLNAASARVF